MRYEVSLTNHMACNWHKHFLILRPATNFQGEEVDDLLPRLHGLRRRHPASDRQLDPLLRQEHEELQADSPHGPLHHAPLSAEVCKLFKIDIQSDTSCCDEPFVDFKTKV